MPCLNQERNKHRSSENSQKHFQTNMLVYFDVKGQQGWTFSLEEALLWITDLYLSRRNSFNLKCCNDGFVSYKHIFLLQKTLIDELKLDYLDYCDVSISCLDSHSDGTHSLKRMHW